MIRANSGKCQNEYEARISPLLPAAFVPPHPISKQKGSYCIFLFPRIDSCFFPGKNARPIQPPTSEWPNHLKAHHPPPPRSSPLFILGLMKLQWSLLSGCVSHWESNCIHKRGGYGSCLFGGLARLEFTWHTAMCSTTHSRTSTSTKCHFVWCCCRIFLLILTKLS